MKKKFLFGLLTLTMLLALLVTSAAPMAFAEKSDEPESVDTGFSNDEETAVTDTVAAPLFTDLTGFESVAKTAKKELLLRTFDGVGIVLAVKDLETGRVAYSVSPKASQLSENEQIRALSVGIVSYVDRTGTTQRVYTGEAFLSKNVKRESVENGIRLTYEFPDTKKGQGFSVPFVFRLVDDHFDAAVELNSIQVDAACESMVASVALLPYFGCAEYGTDGYMLVPDGCGSLIANDYASRDGTVKYFETYVYNYDTTISNVTTNMHLNHTENTSLPVFGTKSDNNASFAVIGAGDALAMVKAVSSREAFPFTSTYAEFLVNKKDSYTQGSKSTNRQTNRASNTEAATVSYYMLADDEADYVGMAGCYRDYLKAAGADSKVSSDLPFYMDLVGAIKKTESVFGVVKEVTKPITTFEQAESMINELSDAGVKNLNVRYLGWTKGGLNSSAVSDIKVESKLGGEDGLNRLKQLLADKNGRLLLDLELIDIYSGKTGWQLNKIAVRDMVSSISKQYVFKLNIGTASDKNFYYRVRGAYIGKQIDSFLEDYKALGVSGISVGSLGDSNYSDFYIGDRFNDAYETREYIREALAGLKENVGSVVVDGGNGYTLPYVETVIAPPMYDSGYEMSASDVPFLQIALHSLVTYTESAHNLNSQPTVQFLRQLETGSVPYYIFTGEESSEFLNTNMNYIYTSQFNTWKETAISCYTQLAQVFNGYCDKPITDHQVLTEDVRLTVYGDDLAVLVNYGDQDYAYGSIQIPAEAFTTVKVSELPVAADHNEEVED